MDRVPDEQPPREAAPNPEIIGWAHTGPLPLDGRLPGTEGNPAWQARLAEIARQQRDPEWRRQFEARMAPWLASMALGEPAAALTSKALPHDADALIIRDPAASEPRLIVLREPAFTWGHYTLARRGLTESEMRTLVIPARVEIALWLDGRVRLSDAQGRVRAWRRQWRYVGGAQVGRERWFRSRFDDAPLVEIRGVGLAHVAPSYKYPRESTPLAADGA